MGHLRALQQGERGEGAEAVREQLELGTCFAMPTESEIGLVELLCDRVPSF